MVSQIQEARWTLVRDELARIDGSLPQKGKLNEKHQKMARSPFQFLRGSAQLFYADLAKGALALPPQLMTAPNTFIMGDCHFSNFGFFTEEGSHGQTVIWAPNDFDDACEGPATFDLLRLLVSLHLVGDYLEGLKTGRYQSEEIEGPISGSAPGPKGVRKACEAFLDAWTQTMKEITKDSQRRNDALEGFSKKHFLAAHYEKALHRTPGAKKFLSKSTLGKLASFGPSGARFQNPHEKMAPLDNKRKQEVIFAIRPYMDDEILDVALRLGAGTGSVNVDRFYILVGPPGPLDEKDYPLVHVVEVKQQREAAMIYHFPQQSPVNRLYPAHLTVDCQRRMMRRPDILLDDLDWEGHHWLIRSRHHARYGVDPEDLLEAENPDKALIQYATACGVSLALAHSRADRRSTRFEKTMIEVMKTHQSALLDAAESYSALVISDHGLLAKLLD